MMENANTYPMQAGLNTREEKNAGSVAKLTIRAAELIAAFKLDVAEYAPTLSPDVSTGLAVQRLADVTVQLGDLLEVLGEIVSELDHGDGITTEREQSIRDEAYQAGKDAGITEGATGESEAWQQAVVSYFDHVGMESEYDGRAFTVPNRWAATDATRDLIATARQMGAGVNL